MNSDTLVDLFYYDFILFKIIEMYHKQTRTSLILPYLKIATVLSAKFRKLQITMDSELYSKEICIKVIQLIAQCKQGCANHQASIMNTIHLMDGVIKDSPVLETDKVFLLIMRVLYTISMAKLEKNQVNKIEPTLIKLNIKRSEFELTRLEKQLYSIQFRNPVMIKFAEYIKSNIDEETPV